MIKTLLAQMGSPASSGGMGWLSRICGKGSSKRVSPALLERQKETEDLRRQLLQLKDKGLSIPIFTL